MLLLSSAEIAAFLLLTCAILAALAGRSAVPFARRAWLPVFGLAVAGGLYAGVAEWRALPWIAALLASAAWYHRHRDSGGWRGWVSLLVLVPLALLVATHHAPGFRSVQAYRGALSATGQPLTVAFSFDKAMVGLLLLASVARGRPGLRQARELVARAGWVWIGTAVVVLSLGWAVGMGAFEPKLASVMLAWAWGNLFFTCVAEEALFRGVLQERLGRLLGESRHGAIAALFLAATLFGAMHFAGGVTYMLLATLAGLGYGWAYMRTGRIESAIIGHFLLNLAHILLLTYPPRV